MIFSPHLRFALLLTALLGPAGAVLHAAGPAFLARPNSTDIVDQVPCGKTLVIPLAAEDADGDALTYTVQSSQTNVMARVMTGNPTLKVNVSYAGVEGDALHPAFTGDLEFQLFRNYTPVTADFIGGFAQAGFYDDVIFHRLINDFVVQGGDKAGNGTGVLGGVAQQPLFKYENEFRPWLIFSGRAQLAMANAGYSKGQNIGSAKVSLGDFSPTNGSQFFITFGEPRFLDFKHTIFGQLVRGFDTLGLIASVPKDANDKPTATLKMSAASVVQSKTDAVLMVSATGIGAAVLTITADDGRGLPDSKAVKQLTVTGVIDTINDPPVMSPIAKSTPAVSQPSSLFLPAVDLEGDALEYAYLFSSNGTASISRFFPNTRLNGLSPAGPVDAPFGVTEIRNPLLNVFLQPQGDGSSVFRVNPPAATAANPFAPFDPFNNIEVAEIGVGDKPIRGTAPILEATAGTALTNAAVASFQSGLSTANANTYSAIVNWGDASDRLGNTGVNPGVTITRSPGTPGSFDVLASHTYARPGTYTVTTILDGPFGATTTVRGTVVVHDPAATLRAIGQDLELTGPSVPRRPLAYFTDTTPGTKVSNYSAAIDWGDGVKTTGTVKQVSPGRFAVLGTHKYIDAETFSVMINIQRTTPSPAAELVWTTLHMKNFSAPRHLSPFPCANITSLWSSAPVKTISGSQTSITGNLYLNNGGNRSTTPWSIRFHLSTDATYDAADTRLNIGPLAKPITEIRLPALVSGAGGNLTIGRAGTADLTIRLPKNETGAGKYLLAELFYSDPLVNLLPVKKVVVFGPLPGIVVSASTVTVKESTDLLTTAIFTVKLDTLPTNNVTIPLDVVGTDGLPDTTEITLSASQLVFTPADGTTAQTVTVTVKDDTIKDGTVTNFIRLKPAVSNDTRFNTMDASDVRATILDDNDTTAP